MLLYLDQNYASRIAKYLLGQDGHAPFGALYRALHRAAGPDGTTALLAPASPFHVLETRGGYLLPTLQGLFAELARGWWLRPWQRVVALQAERGALDRADLLTRGGDWRGAARLEPLVDIASLPLEGDFAERSRQARRALAQRLGVTPRRADALPFFRLLARLLAFRSLDAERRPRDSDLADLIMAATVGPYVDALATDRYLRELMQRVGHRGPVYSGRRAEVTALTRRVEALTQPARPSGPGRRGC